VADAELTRELEAIVAEFTRAWNEKDFPALRALWDPDVAEPVYVPEEADRLIGWDAVTRYWAEAERMIELVHVEPRDLVCQELGPELALAAFVMHVQWLQVTDQTPASNPEVRTSMILRRRDDGWKLVHYVEAPLGGLPLVLRLYQGHVTPEFAAAARAARS
jgi:ketosteroid isomerase-like protein